MKSSETKKKCPYVERDISWMYFNPVSYTHLTLPTILLV